MSDNMDLTYKDYSEGIGAETMKHKTRLYYVMYFDGSHTDRKKYPYAEAEKKRIEIREQTNQTIVLWPIIEDEY